MEKKPYKHDIIFALFGDMSLQLNIAIYRLYQTVLLKSNSSNFVLFYVFTSFVYCFTPLCDSIMNINGRHRGHNDLFLEQNVDK